MNVANGKKYMMNIVEKEATNAPRVPTYGYQIAREIGGMVIRHESIKFFPLDSLLLISSPCML